MTTITDPDSVLTWSTLMNNPLCYYDEYYDAHMCCWNGIRMTRSYGMMIACKTWMALYPSDTMKEHAWLEVCKLARCGILDEPEFTELENSKNKDTFIQYLTYSMNRVEKNFLSTLKDKYTPQQALLWFSPEQERALVRTIITGSEETPF